MKFVNILSSVIALYAVYYALLIAWDTYIQKRNNEDKTAPVDVFNPASEMANYNAEQVADAIEQPVVTTEKTSQDSTDETSVIIDRLPASVLLRRLQFEKSRGPEALEDMLDGLDIQWAKVSTDAA